MIRTSLLFLFYILLFACNNNHSNSYDKQKDSLLVILNYQLTVFEKMDFKKPNDTIVITDTLSIKDSTFFFMLQSNFVKSKKVIDTIQQIYTAFKIQMDSLNKNNYSIDSVLLQQLQLLIEKNNKYIYQYNRASSITEQNNQLLQYLNGK